MIARQSRPHNRMLRMPCATRIYSLFGETMCGIVGIISENAIDPGLVRLMCGTIVHRGPDDEGIFTTRRLSSGGRESTVSLGHRRLSIIDISDAAHQPMTSSDGTCHIVYNGEVYNFLELRKELEQEGHKFRSNSDTEVVLYAYQHWGTDCIKRFNGMFALAIYDGQNDLLFLARDRAGKKPLYYSKLPGDFLFASEIKALLPYQGISRELDLQALNHYFTVGYIPGELCIFRDIRKLPPAHALTYRPGSKELKIWQYFSLSGEEPAPERDVEGLVEEARLLLADSVKRRLISDVPLGAFLSGGVDSSIVVAMMAEASAKPVKTFSIGFEESSFNELPYARIVAKHFATEHHEMVVTTEAMSILPELAKQYDLIPTYYVCRETRRHVTVALSGDGGDELFGGYKSYLATKLGSGFHRLFPNPVGAALCVPFAFLPDRFKLKRNLQWMCEDPCEVYVKKSSSAYFDPLQRGHLLSPFVLEHLGDNLLLPEQTRLSLARNCTGEPMRHVMRADTLSFLPDDILVKVDRASMKVSLEVRCPFLDHRIIEFSFHKVAPSLKVRGLTNKFLLKKLARRLLPKELPIERKQGFAVPVAKWFRGELGEHLEELIRSGGSEFVRREYALQLLEQHRTGFDHSARLFTLIMFYLWCRQYLPGR
jgi:asparagine synthase (glutamine-hydrolysing)